MDALQQLAELRLDVVGADTGHEVVPCLIHGGLASIDEQRRRASEQRERQHFPAKPGASPVLDGAIGVDRPAQVQRRQRQRKHRDSEGKNSAPRGQLDIRQAQYPQGRRNTHGKLRQHQ